ncbi:hypothetical protein [Paenibacillus larvae]|uniref:Uncharacterized protein n=1 Tax=Paenibacillus larvae subsp. larvae DSM 25430 TaxID=697284 RepID=V9W6D5_9BACL|nr:hypothetical protein [Paenibacillus larvae]AHD04687.1 hypothetical protein ERIC2_c08540 [Paenibacillus larvae subsp. larvae DSM 25430]MDR5566979.1 hypothetical protein [Paenibacillus larvae]MDR5595025.1 hypothetical protein [Paenibacillus larvae]
MITHEERFELLDLLNKRALKHKEFFDSKEVDLDSIPNWIDYRCYYILGDTLAPLFRITICTKNRRILKDRCTTDKEEHINRYYPIIEEFLSS